MRGTSEPDDDVVREVDDAVSRIHMRLREIDRFNDVVGEVSDVAADIFFSAFAADDVLAMAAAEHFYREHVDYLHEEVAYLLGRALPLWNPQTRAAAPPSTWLEGWTLGATVRIVLAGELPPWRRTTSVLAASIAQWGEDVIGASLHGLFSLAPAAHSRLRLNAELHALPNWAYSSAPAALPPVRAFVVPLTERLLRTHGQQDTARRLWRHLQSHHEATAPKATSTQAPRRPLGQSLAAPRAVGPPYGPRMLP